MPLSTIYLTLPTGHFSLMPSAPGGSQCNGTTGIKKRILEGLLTSVILRRSSAVGFWSTRPQAAGRVVAFSQHGLQQSRPHPDIPRPRSAGVPPRLVTKPQKHTTAPADSYEGFSAEKLFLFQIFVLITCLELDYLVQTFHSPSRPTSSDVFLSRETKCASLWEHS